ncbi:hypothetical protein Vafri_15491 [Volvox africanus]|uniref:Uncharacterized protein n=1 Tax=Volvox africanus TaxID=51714 RepID=A0A8J4F5V3_9CHLO|nr:hypothetical protein Vafri_15491 [Volvox africanus]
METSLAIGRRVVAESSHRCCHLPSPVFPFRPTLRHRLRNHSVTIICMAQRRRMIIKRRTPPAALRKKRRFADESQSLELDPQSTRFSGRLTTELNSANGPIQLLRLIQSYGLYFSGTQVTMALARLAAFATYQELSDEQLAAQARATRRCVLLLRQRLHDCDLISYARASYSLGRLDIYDEGLMAEVVEEVYDKLNLFSPDGLAALLTGMSLLGHRPPDRWLNVFALEVYTRFSRFNGQELANIMYGIARLQYNPSAAWVERCMECFRAVMSLPSVPPMAPAMVKFGFGLASLQIRPSFNWTTAFIARARPLLDTLAARELSVLLWSMSRMLKPTGTAPARAMGTAADSRSTSSGLGTGMSSAAVMPQDAEKAESREGGAATATTAEAAVSVGLDREFLDAWFRCSARRMSSSSAASLVLALQALAVLQVTQLPSKYVNAMLARLLTAVPSGRLKAGAAAQRQASAAGTSLSGVEMVSVLLSLVALRIRPGPEWMESYLTGLESNLTELEAPVLCDLAWALARLQYQPSPEWAKSFTSKCLMFEGELTDQQISLLAWTYQQLRLSRPELLQNVPELIIRS